LGVLERIIFLIKEKGITEKAFLMEMGFDKSTLGDWKKERSKSYLKYTSIIAQYFNVSTDYLLGLTDERTPYVSEKTAVNSDFSDKQRAVIAAVLALDESELDKALKILDIVRKEP